MISVIIPTHNRADLLERAIDSAINQTIKDIEIIVVSDGSTDNTDALMEKLLIKESRLIYETYSEARGANYARNKGIQLAKGEYIAFLDDDDEWNENKLEKQLQLFKNNERVGLVYTGSNIVYVNENISYLNSPNIEGDLSRTILLKNLVGTTSTVMVRTSVLKKTNLFDTKLKALQDYDLWIRICQLVQVGVIQEPCINYYNYTGKKQISQHTEKYEEAIKSIEKKYNNLFNTLSKQEMKLRESNSYTLLANKSMRNNSKIQALHYSAKSFMKNPSIKSFIYIGLSLLNFKYILKFRKLMSS